MVADVLGFSAIVANSAREEIEPRIQEWVSLVESASSRHGIEQRLLFSDTVFAAAPSSETGLRSLAQFAQDLLQSGLEKHFLVRGGISHGSYIWGSLTYGKAVIDAYKLEQSQNWIGVSCQGSLPHEVSTWNRDLLVAYPAPLKAGEVQIRATVAWNIPRTEQLFEAVAKSKSIRAGHVVGWEIAGKLDNTVLFRSYLHLLRAHSLDPARFYGSLPSHFVDNAVSQFKL